MAVVIRRNWDVNADDNIDQINLGNAGIITQDEGVEIDAAATTLNFVGAGVTATDAGSNVTTVTIPGGGSSPLTTKGDLFTYDTGDARLPVGADGQILSANSATATGLEWIAASGGGETYVDINSTGVAASATGTDAIAIGEDATSSSPNAVAIGRNADASSNQNIAIGNNASASTSFNAIAIGNAAVTTTTSAVQIGSGTNSTASTLQFLTNRLANAEGLYTNFTAPTNYTPGDNDNVTSHLQAIDTALGSTGGETYFDDNFDGGFPQALGTDSLVIGEGSSADATSPQAIVIGKNSDALSTSNDSIVVGLNCTATTANRSIVMGYFTTISSANESIALGYTTDVTGNRGVAIGYDCSADASSVAIGRGGATGSQSIAIGNFSGASASQSIGIGRSAIAQATDAVQLGVGTNSTASTLQYLSNTIANSDGVQVIYQTTGATPTITPANGTLVLDNNGGVTTLYARANGAWVALVSV